MQAAQLQGLRHTLQGLHHGQVSGNNAASSAIRLTLFSLRVYHYKGGGGEPITKARNRSIPLPLRFVSPPISFLRPFALTLYTRVHARTTITRRDNDDPDRADNRLFARPRFLCILLRGERERKLRSSRVLITPGVASGQHFIFALPATFLIPVATGRPKNILIVPSPLNTFYARLFLSSSPPTVEFLRLSESNSFSRIESRSRMEGKGGCHGKGTRALVSGIVNGPTCQQVSLSRQFL